MKNKKTTYLSYSTKTFLGLAMTAAGIGAFGFAQNNAYAAETHQVLNSSTQKKNITKTTHSQVSTTKTSLSNTKPTITSTQVPNTKHTTSTKSAAVKSATSTKPTTMRVTSKSTAPTKTTKPTTKKVTSKSTTPTKTTKPTTKSVTSKSTTPTKTTKPTTKSVTSKSTTLTKTPVTSKNKTLNKTQSTIVKKIDAPKTSVTKTPSSTTTKRQLTQTSKAPVMVTPPVYKLGSVKSTDYYRSMTDLLKDTQEGKDWTKENTNRHSNVLIFAPHGGNIEKGTTELTKAIANKGNYDYYVFNGTRNKNNSQLHVTSTNYNDPDLINRNYNKDISISVHGAGQSQGKNTVLIGGRDEKLIQLISKELSTFKFNVQRSLGHLAGIDTNNVVNYNKKGQGVQLELTPDLRKSFFSNGDDSSKARKNEKNWTSTMDRFATAINNTIRKYTI
ncbi:MAG: poly-gamma-glutamate hydrolase family protein [Staphylococcus sp.]|mgnify:CR=1 FL=1|nr:poly-gamma-glutamate hydrolase family protein [Staphylococcus sp.]